MQEGEQARKISTRRARMWHVRLRTDPLSSRDTLAHLARATAQETSSPNIQPAKPGRSGETFKGGNKN